jgi:hypothetical protein
MGKKLNIFEMCYGFGCVQGKWLCIQVMEEKWCSLQESVALEYLSKSDYIDPPSIWLL